ncbi:MAG TPA: LysM domain-containing protein [Solirubrobacteraceae bacterium]|jgi:LysM repeat protein
MAKRRRRTPARWLAPLALVTCAVAVYAVVDNTLLNDDTTSTSTTTSQPATKTKTTSSKPKKHRRVYIVKSGDTLSAISLKTGVSLATIQRLNPKLDADTLHAGQRVRLAR